MSAIEQALRIAHMTYFPVTWAERQTCIEQAHEELSALRSLETAARGLVEYRRRAGPLNFQLEKADDFINEMRNILADASAKNSNTR